MGTLFCSILPGQVSIGRRKKTGSRRRTVFSTWEASSFSGPYLLSSDLVKGLYPVDVWSSVSTQALEHEATKHYRNAVKQIRTSGLWFFPGRSGFHLIHNS